MHDDLLPALPPGRLPALVQPLGRRLRFLRAKEVWALLDDAVEHGLGRALPKTDARQLHALQRQVRLEFVRLVRERARTVRGMSRGDFLHELERSRDETLAERDKALVELRGLRERSAHAEEERLPGDPIEVYERRIAKLNEALQQAEKELAEAALDVDEGVSSNYRQPQGLARDADRRAQRLALLREIFTANRRLQRS